MTDLRHPLTGIHIEMRPIDALIPHVRNAKQHSDAQVAQIAASIREFGWGAPILVDGQNNVIAGHGRLLAARKLGLAEVPVVPMTHLTGIQRRALILADNKIGENAEWDDELLGLELSELHDAGFDLELTGFDADEIADLLVVEAVEGLTDPDAAPEVQAVAVTKQGDVWLMGKHRIICGSSTDASTVEKVLNGVQPHLMVTDPPYGVVYDANWRNEAMRSDGTAIAGRAIGKVLNDDNPDWREAWALFPGDVAYVWHAGLFAGVVAESLEACDFKLRSQIIWAKSNFAIGRGDYHWHHEPCWYAVRKKAKNGHYNGDRKQTTLWQIPKPAKSETGHSTQKPVECMKRPIENNSSPGQAVYEPFSGSGTTIIAAEMTGRCCYAIELNPAYVDVAVKRWQEFTGQEAKRASDGAKFVDKVDQAAAS